MRRPGGANIRPRKSEPIPVKMSNLIYSIFFLFIAG